MAKDHDPPPGARAQRQHRNVVNVTNSRNSSCTANRLQRSVDRAKHQPVREPDAVDRSLKGNPVSGIIATAGWILPNGGGDFGANGVQDYPGTSCGKLSELEGLIGGPIKNFGRFPSGVRDICAACALASRAGVSVGKDTRMPTGLIVAGFDRTLAVNSEFFRDYVDNGRVMGRANLFIYTLPTSAIAEASIIFDMQGPILFLDADDAPFVAMLNTAQQLTDSGQADAMVVAWQDQETTLCALFVNRPDNQTGLTCEAVLQAAQAWCTPADGVRYFKTRA